jgi:ribonuclease E
MTRAVMVLTDKLIQAARAKGQAPVEGADQDDLDDEDDIAIDGEFAEEDFDDVDVDEDEDSDDEDEDLDAEEDKGK